MTDLSQVDSPKHPQIPKLNDVIEEDLSRSGLDFEFIDENKKLNELASIAKTILENTELDQHPLRSNVERLTSEILSNADKLKSFDPKGDDPSQIRQSIRNLYQNLHREENQFKGVKGLYLDKKLEEGSFAELKDYKTELEEEVNRLRNIANELSSKSKDELTTNYSKTFDNQADKHSSWWPIGQAQIYLLLAIAISVVLIFFFENLFGTFGDHLTEFNEIKETYKDSLENVGLTHFLIVSYLKKIVILGLLLFGVKFCFKQYSINQHLHVLNKHRANSLKSFDLLFNNLTEPEQKEKFLIDIANIIYEPKETGYSMTNKGDKISLLDSLNIGNNKASEGS